MSAELSRDSIATFQDQFTRLRTEINKRIVGYQNIIEQVLSAGF